MINCTLQSELQYLQSFVCTDIYILHTELQDLLYPAYSFVCVDSCILHTNWSARSVFCSFVCTDSCTVAARSAVTCIVLCAQIVALCIQTELQNLLYSAQIVALYIQTELQDLLHHLPALCVCVFTLEAELQDLLHCVLALCEQTNWDARCAKHCVSRQLHSASRAARVAAYSAGVLHTEELPPANTLLYCTSLSCKDLLHIVNTHMLHSTRLSYKDDVHFMSTDILHSTNKTNWAARCSALCVYNCILQNELQDVVDFVQLHSTNRTNQAASCSTLCVYNCTLQAELQNVDFVCTAALYRAARCGLWVYKLHSTDIPCSSCCLLLCWHWSHRALAVLWWKLAYC